MGVQLSYLTAHQTDQGLQRNYNQDATAIYEPSTVDADRFQRGNLYVLADGMGGHQAGEVASHYSVDALVFNYYESEWLGIEETLRSAYLQANREIYQQQVADVSFKGMGSTLVTAAIIDGSVTIANVGDSRAYILRDGLLTRLTEDHSWVAEQIRLGELTEVEGENHPNKNWITRNIGGEATIEVDFSAPLELLPDDIILLCSDGLHGPVPEREIQQILMDNWLSPDSSVQQLIAAANHHGGPDNISAIVVHAVSSENRLSPTSARLAPPTTAPARARQPLPPYLQNYQLQRTSPSAIDSLLSSFGLKRRYTLPIILVVLLLIITASYLVGLRLGGGPEENHSGLNDGQASSLSDGTVNTTVSKPNQQVTDVPQEGMTLTPPQVQGGSIVQTPVGETDVSGSNQPAEVTDNVTPDVNQDVNAASNSAQGDTLSCDQLSNDQAIVPLNGPYTDTELSDLASNSEFSAFVALDQLPNYDGNSPYRFIQGEEVCAIFLVEEHQIAQEDTLGRIADSYEVPLDLLQIVNGIPNRNLIRAGDLLLIPTRLAASPTSAVTVPFISRNMLEV